MADLLDLATSVEALRGGYERAASNRAGPGPDGVTLLEFSRDLDAQLAALSNELRGGGFQPQPGQRILLERPDGRSRKVILPSVRDRIVHHALAAVMARHLDDELRPSAYAYRKGRSGLMAMESLDEQIRAGKEWVFRGDIEDFFDHIDHALISNAIGLATGEVGLVSLVEKLLRAGQFAGGIIFDTSTGAAQGSALSPFLANLVMAPFDRAIEELGHTMVRYGDDVCIPLASCHEAMQVEGRVRLELDRLGLQLSEEKVIIARAREGFEFLGFAFDADGRRPGERAVQKLLGKLDALLGSGRPDTAEDVDRLLQGWVAYYGPLSHLPLPGAVVARAEQIEAAWAERRQLRDAVDDVSSVNADEASANWDDETERLARQGQFDQAAQAAARRRRLPLVPSHRSGPVPGAPPGVAEAPEGEATPGVTRPAASPAALAVVFGGCGRAQEMYAGCNVLRALVDRASSGQGLLASERFLVADILGRLGDEAERSCEGVFRHLVDHKPGMARRFLQKLFPMPTSCARIRQRMPELTAEVGCSCRFRLQAGAYPTPVLHVLGAAEVPGLEGRVQKATLKRSVAKSVLDAMNAGRKDMGDKAAALCTRLADARRQVRLLQQEMEKLEEQLGALLDEAGEGALETPAGTLRRVLDESGRARFVLEV